MTSPNHTNGSAATHRVAEESRSCELAERNASNGSGARDSSIFLSVVVPVFNEELNLPALFDRLFPVLDALGRTYEVVFTNDGSADRSMELLRAQYAARPEVTRVIDFSRNHGQHMAIIAAFERVCGEVIMTLDADLQNPPEEIPKLLASIAAGHDYVGGIRVDRKDPAFRRCASRTINCVRARITNIRMTDQGCMLRAYRRPITDAIVRSGAINTFIPALAYTFAASPMEVNVRHDQRHAGQSAYSLFKLTRLNFDLITAFSQAPLQYFTLFGLAASGASFVLVLVLAGRWMLFRPADGAVILLLGVLVFLVSVTMFGIGLIGEYVGRADQVVRTRERYQIREVLEA